MFDGLREKLGRFSDDVEDDVDEEEPTVDSAEDSEEPPAAEQGPARAADTDETVEAPDDASAPVETDTGESPETSADDQAADDRGIAERAKLFATGKTVIDEEDLDDHLDELELALLSSDVEMSVAGAILDNVETNLVGETRRRLESTGNLAQDALREALYEVISVGQFDFEARIAAAQKPVVIVFTGVNGVGKTTTIAKLARYLEERGYSSVLANGDTYRAG
ncbi:MAG: signal recognition particle receptor subunit alpha, partial [Halorhabdus sp.]